MGRFDGVNNLGLNHRDRYRLLSVIEQLLSENICKLRF